jgi:two-component system chemotaxis response regulator CheB
MMSRLRVVVADDSPFVCRLLTSFLQSSPDIEVVGTALNGARALELVKTLTPHALTLDLEMPDMNGLQALEQIMIEAPLPVIMVSGVSHHAAAVTLQALELGAVDFVLKYTPGIDTNPELLRQELIAKVRAAAQVKVIRALRSRQPKTEARAIEYPPESATGRSLGAILPGGVVIIGASTGGPLALRELLGNLPADFPAAVIVIQHMPASFTGVLAAQLDRQVSLQIKEARNGDPLRPGLALVAPGNYHLLLDSLGRVLLKQGPAVGGHRPSIDVTMQSAAQIFGGRVKGVVLTGMGDDGALGLVSIQAKGGQTFAQDAASCVVNGMPQRAIEKKAAQYVASPAEIARLLQRK